MQFNMSAVLDLLGEVVGPPTKAHSWWLSVTCKNSVVIGTVTVMCLKFCHSRLSPVCGPKI